MSTHLTEAQLHASAEGALDAVGRAAAEGHLEQCAQCRAEVTGIRTLLAGVDHLPRSIDPPRDLWPEIRHGLRRSGPGVRWWLLAAAAVVLLVVGVQFLRFGPPNAWGVESLAGTPRIGTAIVTGRAALREGEWLETDGISRARIAVGRIGEVEVRPRTRVRLLDARPAAHRLALARGAIEAKVDAPPRLFIVETPAGTAIDLGCAYTLETDSLGNGAIHVTAGWVEFAWRERRSIVPLGFTALTRAGMGPGTPVAHDAPAPLREAVTAFDFRAGGAAAARAALASARAEDAVSLWHLLARVERRLRAEVYDGLVELVPPPDGVTRQAALNLDAATLERYWSTIRRIAWRREVLKGVRDIDPSTGLTR
jgi:anti-sigma factor RsiW